MSGHNATRSNYNEKSCSTLEKAYYRPVEAALRWCGLIDLEPVILGSLQDSHMPALGDFPQWPCLRVNTEKIFDAIENNELPYGRDGKTVRDGDHVAKSRVTVRHTDLKVWMANHYPDQKPDFLFGETERASHPAINADSFRALQADRDALRSRAEAAEKSAAEERAKRADAEAELKKLKTQLADFSTKERNTLLTIIGVLCGIARLDFKKSAKTARSIQDEADRMGFAIGETTIEGYLKKIDDALETRMK